MPLLRIKKPGKPATYAHGPHSATVRLNTCWNFICGNYDSRIARALLGVEMQSSDRPDFIKAYAVELSIRLRRTVVQFSISCPAASLTRAGRINDHKIATVPVTVKVFALGGTSSKLVVTLHRQ